VCIFIEGKKTDIKESGRFRIVFLEWGLSGNRRITSFIRGGGTWLAFAGASKPGKKKNAKRPSRRVQNREIRALVAPRASGP